MNNPCRDDQDATVVGFEVPRSPDSSYNNVYPGSEDEGREPPVVPPHLQQTMLNCPPTRDPSVSLPSPQNVTLNHLYLENREAPPRSVVALGVGHRREAPPSSVVALGVTHRFRSKFVTVVLYKPVQRSGSSST